MVGEAQPPEPDSVERDDDAGAGHAERGDLGAEGEAIERAGGDRDRQAVVAGRPAEVLSFLAAGVAHAFPDYPPAPDESGVAYCPTLAVAGAASTGASSLPRRTG